jgi:AcrR family transcriptional regulator
MADTKNTKTERSNKADRRSELLKVAREIFAEKGYEATTISEIVARAGVAQGTFYWHFPSKTSLIVTLAEEMEGQIEDTLVSTYTATEHLSEMIERSVTRTFHIMEQYRDVLAIIRSTTSNRLVQTPSEHARVFTPYYALIANFIRQEQAKGTLNPSINADVTATLIVGTIYYTAEECYVYHSPIPAETFITEAAHFVQRALGIL